MILNKAHIIIYDAKETKILGEIRNNPLFYETLELIHHINPRVTEKINQILSSPQELRRYKGVLVLLKLISIAYFGLKLTHYLKDSINRFKQENPYGDS